MRKIFKKETNDEDEISKKIKSIIAEHFRVDIKTIKRKTDFRKDLAADSLDIIEAVVLLEMDLEQRIPEKELDNLFTVGDIIDYVAKEKESE